MTSKRPALRVLLVEDNAADALLIVRQLERSYVVKWIRVETEADLRAALRETWDIVLVDYALPSFSAPVALVIIQELAPETPAIIVSGTARDDDGPALIRAGAAGYLLKDRLAGLGDTVAHAIADAQAFDDFLEIWADALAMRDQETEGHSKRVVEMTVALARMMGVPDPELIHIRRGALLHDIGKIAIPDAILLKPGPLTKAEWLIMHTHPQRACDMLKSNPRLALALPIPCDHHQRWDGTGYPDGKKGEEIPLAARIFAVVDAWDAMRTDRVYRKAMTRDAALAAIRAGRGSHFDPGVVDVFCPAIEAGML
jgi:putative nucleotidyltransferase with HDIG domain